MKQLYISNIGMLIRFGGHWWAGKTSPTLRAETEHNDNFPVLVIINEKEKQKQKQNKTSNRAG